MLYQAKRDIPESYQAWVSFNPRYALKTSINFIRTYLTISPPPPFKKGGGDSLVGTIGGGGGDC